MSDDSHRSRQLMLLSLLFLGAMAALYTWMTRSHPSGPGPAEDLPAVTPAPTPELATRPATRPAPARPAFRPPSPSPTERISEDEPPPVDPLMPVELDVRVVDDQDEPLYRALVRVTSSTQGGNRRLLTDDKGRVTARLKAGELAVVAERADGMLTTKSEPVVVDATEGGSWEIELVVPSEPRAGLGVGIKPHVDGVEVLTVHAGTPAEEAGLGRGDVIVAVEGEETAGMPLSDFIARMTGPEGTKVLFDVVHPDGTEERLQVERAFIERLRRPDDG